MLEIYVATLEIIRYPVFARQCDKKYGSLVLRSRVPSLSDDSEQEAEEGEEQEEAFSLSRFSSNAVKQVCMAKKEQTLPNALFFSGFVLHYGQ